MLATYTHMVLVRKDYSPHCLPKGYVYFSKQTVHIRSRFVLNLRLNIYTSWESGYSNVSFEGRLRTPDAYNPRAASIWRAPEVCVRLVISFLFLVKARTTSACGVPASFQSRSEFLSVLLSHLDPASASRNVCNSQIAQIWALLVEDL